MIKNFLQVKYLATDGFSLLETLIYIAIAIVVLAISALILLSSQDTFRLSYGRRVLGIEGQAALSRVILETRAGNSIDVGNSVFGSASSTLSIMSTDINNNPTTVKFFVATSTLFVKVGATSAFPLTSSSTKVMSFVVSRFSTLHSEGITALLTLASTGKIPTTALFEDSAIVRGTY